MKFILILLLFTNSLFCFEVTQLKRGFHDGKYHLYFSIDGHSQAIINSEEENISLTLDKGSYDIALDYEPLKITFDKEEKSISHEDNSSLNIIYPKHKQKTSFLLASLRAVKVPKNITFKSILDEVQNKRVIFVGESHDQFAHHLNQLKIIKSLYKRGKKIAIGMEMFQRKFQYVLNDYLQDKISQETFLKKSEYEKRWGFNYKLYKPIIEYAKLNNIPIIALNLERELTKKISKNGLLKLTDKEKSKLPQTIDFSNREYKNNLIKFFSSHQHGKKSKKMNLEFIYQAQILWDQTMADSINNYLTKHADKNMVVLVGSGHLKFSYGIPDRVTYPHAIILQDEEAEPKSADFILFTDSIKIQSSK